MAAVRDYKFLLKYSVPGCLAVLWFLLWCLIVAESPAKHPSISNKELEYIQGSIGYTDEQTQVGFC